MDNTVADLWTTIEDELAEHAPSVLPTLNPPATDTDIERLESTIGHPIPHDVRASLARHNGQHDPSRLQRLCEAGILLSTDRMLGVWQVLTDLDRQLDEEIPDRSGIDWWNPGYLPITNCEGDHLCVSLLPDGFGEVLWFVHDDTVEHDVFPSYTDWLRSVALVFTERHFLIDGGYLDFPVDLGPRES